MLENNQDIRKLDILLNEKRKGALDNSILIIGTSITALADYQKTNTESKFAYLMRHPTAANEIGMEVSEAVLHSFQLSVTGSVNNWLTMYAEILYDPEQSFGAGTITSLTRNQLQLRRGIIAFGDLNKFPLYGAIGKFDAPFGMMGSVNPFSNTSMWHAFAGLGYGALAGFTKWNLNASVMAIQGGAQFRGLNTPVGDSTNVPSKLNNFAADINYTFIIHDDYSLKLGGSYLYGSAYNQEFPVIHFGPGKSNNPAYTFYGVFSFRNILLMEGGYVTTVNVWPGTHNPNPPLDVFEASKVSSIDAGIKYTFNADGKIPISASAEFSKFISGPEGSPWQRQNQIIVGFSSEINKSVRFFTEYFRTVGYTPLNFISGGNLAPGKTHSDRDVNTFGIVLGGMVTL